MALSDIFGINSDAGTDELKQAIAALQAVGVPNAAELTLPELQKYVAAGVLTPQQYSAIQEDPQAYQQAFNAASDNEGKTAQSAALQQLGSIVQAGGSTPINQANLENNINQTNQAMQAARGGIENQAQQRGVSGGGLEYISKLMNEQANAQNAHMGAVQAGADNAQLALQALANQGNLGSTMQGQANQSQQAQAEAARQIAQYNSQLQSAANQYNTQNANQAQQMNLANAQDISNQNVGNANYRTLYNAQIPQQIFQDQMSKAGGVANAYGNMGQLQQRQAGQQNAFLGNLIGAGATVAGGMYGGPAGAAAGSQIGKSVAGQKKDPYSYDPMNMADGGMVGQPPTDYHLRPGGDVVKGQQPHPQHGGGHSGGIPKEALMALAGVMAAYPILKYGFGNSAPQQTTLQQDVGRQMSSTDTDPMNMCDGGLCYAQGGEVHDHELCMQAGGDVPGDESGMPPMRDDESQDTVHANLSPGEIVLPRSVAQAPDAPQQAAQFVGQTKGQPPMGGGASFADVLAQLEANGIELRLTSRGE